MKPTDFRSRSVSVLCGLSLGLFLTSIRAHAQPGALDPSFKFAVSDVFPSTAAVQADGKVVIGGGFGQVLGQPRGGLARLLADGTLDTTFSVGKGVQVVTDPIVLPGNIVISPGGTIAGAVNSADVQADGKVVIVGNFNRYDGATTVNIARLNANGALDASFNTGAGLDSGGNWVKVLPSGKILAVGGKKYRGTALNLGVVRINPDGSFDSSFNGPVLDFGGSLGGVEVQADGKIVGAASYLNSSFRLVTQIIRLNEDGSLDATWTRGTLAAGSVARCMIQPDGKVVVGGTGFTTYDGVPVKNLFRLTRTGAVDQTFDASVLGSTFVVSGVADSTGRLVLCRGGVGDSTPIRLLADGAKDATFSMPTGFGAYGFQLQSDGKILVRGNQIAGVTLSFGLYRLNGGGAAIEAPTISQNPSSLTVVEGGAVTLSVTANGAAPLTYQWARDGKDIAGAVGASLNLPKTLLADAGTYTVRVTNAGGSVVSTAAVLTVTPAPVATPASIQVVSANGALTLSWPTGYTLQATTTLLGANWADAATASPFTAPTTGVARFFRLIKR